MDGPAGERRLTFTGDLGRPGLPILRDPAPVPPGDLLISESTYGGHTHEPVEETAERLGEVVRRTAARGGKVVIPAFAVGRTQTVVYFLHQLMNAGRLPDLPIYVDSPMARAGDRGVPVAPGVLQRTDAAACWRRTPTCSAKSGFDTSTKSTKASR